MEVKRINKLLLKTAFSCMACDGEIDKREVKLIKKLQKENKTFGEIDINTELNTLLLDINDDGQQFLINYFNELKASDLSESDEMKLIEVAIDTIKADKKIEYSEIKFFKVIRSKLNIDDKSILKKHPDFEDYLEQDILTESYLARLQDDFFNTHVTNEFELISEMDDDTLNSLKD